MTHESLMSGDGHVRDQIFELNDFIKSALSLKLYKKYEIEDGWDENKVAFDNFFRVWYVNPDKSDGIKIDVLTSRPGDVNNIISRTLAFEFLGEYGAYEDPKHTASIKTNKCLHMPFGVIAFGKNTDTDLEAEVAIMFVTGDISPKSLLKDVKLFIQKNPLPINPPLPPVYLEQK